MGGSAEVGSADWDAVTGVGLTALAAAAIRAVESGQPDLLVSDPYAAAFVRAAGQLPTPLPTTPEEATTVAAPLIAAFSDHFAVKSRFFDDYFAAAGGAGIRQAVILAAGLDTRAYRLNWPDGSTVYELDAAGV
jgi:methyltransferase (TIGR00027 family)